MHRPLVEKFKGFDRETKREHELIKALVVLVDSGRFTCIDIISPKGDETENEVISQDKRFYAEDELEMGKADGTIWELPKGKWSMGADDEGYIVRSIANLQGLGADIEPLRYAHLFNSSHFVAQFGRNPNA